jgi:hypothetical protein
VPALFDQGSSGHWPAGTWVQAIGKPTAPPVVQHLKPVRQSPSAKQAAPAPPLPGTQVRVSTVSMPWRCALQALEYEFPSQPHTAVVQS